MPMTSPLLFFCLSVVHSVPPTAKMVNHKNGNDNPNVPTFKEVRDRLGMSQDAFAKALGLSRKTIGRYERGEHKRIALSPGQIKKLVQLMESVGMSVDDLPDDIE